MGRTAASTKGCNYSKGGIITSYYNTASVYTFSGMSVFRGKRRKKGSEMCEDGRRMGMDLQRIAQVLSFRAAYLRWGQGKILSKTRRRGTKKHKGGVVDTINSSAQRRAECEDEAGDKDQKIMKCGGRSTKRWMVRAMYETERNVGGRWKSG